MNNEELKKLAEEIVVLEQQYKKCISECTQIKKSIASEEMCLQKTVTKQETLEEKQSKLRKNLERSGTLLENEKMRVQQRKDALLSERNEYREKSDAQICELKNEISTLEALKESHEKELQQTSFFHVAKKAELRTKLDEYQKSMDLKKAKIESIAEESRAYLLKNTNEFKDCGHDLDRYERDYINAEKKCRPGEEEIELLNKELQQLNMSIAESKEKLGRASEDCLNVERQLKLAYESQEKLKLIDEKKKQEEIVQTPLEIDDTSMQEKAQSAVSKEQPKVQKQESSVMDMKTDKTAITMEKHCDNRLASKFEKLEMYYPEHKVFCLYGLDDDLYEGLRDAGRKAGYEDLSMFLKANGYEVIDVSEAKTIRPEVIYSPRNEPEIISTKIFNCIWKLKRLYPDGLVSTGFSKTKLYERLNALSHWLGYESVQALLKAYGFGYEPKTGRRVSVDEQTLIEELKRRTEGQQVYSIVQLGEMNPDLKSQLKTLANRYSGQDQSFAELLKDHGILSEQPKIEKKKPAKKSEAEKEAHQHTLTVSRIKERKNLGKHTVEEIVGDLEGMDIRYSSKLDAIVLQRSNRTDREIVLPEVIGQIYSHAFVNESSLVKLTVPRSLQCIEKEAFVDCVNLESITLLNLKCKIANTAFVNCPKLQLVRDRSKQIEKFMKSVPEQQKSQFLDRIETIGKCLDKNAIIDPTFWVNDDMQLAFSEGNTMYQTPVGFISEDATEIDRIIEEVFGYERIQGTTLFYKYTTSNNISVKYSEPTDLDGFQICGRKPDVLVNLDSDGNRIE